MEALLTFAARARDLFKAVAFFCTSHFVANRLLWSLKVYHIDTLDYLRLSGDEREIYINRCMDEQDELLGRRMRKEVESFIRENAESPEEAESAIAKINTDEMLLGPMPKWTRLFYGRDPMVFIRDNKVNCYKPSGWTFLAEAKQFARARDLLERYDLENEDADE